MYAYKHDPWTQTMGGEALEWGVALDRVNGGKKGTYVILSTMKILC